MGYSVGVVTAGSREVEVLRELPKTTVISLNARASTSFENVYGPGGRQQLLRALAPRIPAELVPPEWHTCPTVLLAPVANEVPPTLARSFGGSMVGVCAQGYLRRLMVGKQVHCQVWDRPEKVLSHVVAAIFSEEDLGWQTPGWLQHPGPVFVMTRGAAGCELIHDGRRRFVFADRL